MVCLLMGKKSRIHNKIDPSYLLSVLSVDHVSNAEAYHMISKISFCNIPFPLLQSYLCFLSSLK